MSSCIGFAACLDQDQAAQKVNSILIVDLHHPLSDANTEQILSLLQRKMIIKDL